MFERYLRTALFGVMLMCVSAALYASVQEYMDATGTTPIKASYATPMPVIGSGTWTTSVTNVAEVSPQGATSISGEVFSVTTSPASWTLTASATDFVLQNLGATTVWVDYNSGGATVSAGMPLTATGTMHDMISRDAAQGVVIWLVASETVSIYRAEGRR